MVDERPETPAEALGGDLAGDIELPGDGDEVEVPGDGDEVEVPGDGDEVEVPGTAT